jgi:hypothetical protein
MHSLGRNVERLRKYYIELKVTTSPRDLHPYFFPSIRAYHDENDRVIKFKYVHPLEQEPMCVTFLAKTNTDTPKLVVVKFVERYGEEAHCLLARENLAPQIFYYGKIGVLEGDPSYEHLRMVVMEHINGETLNRAKHVPPLRGQI